jgi:hypothetical protein
VLMHAAARCWSGDGVVMHAAACCHTSISTTFNVKLSLGSTMPGGESGVVQKGSKGFKIQRGQGDRRQAVGRGGEERYKISVELRDRGLRIQR